MALLRELETVIVEVGGIEVDVWVGGGWLAESVCGSWTVGESRSEAAPVGDRGRGRGRERDRRHYAATVGGKREGRGSSRR